MTGSHWQAISAELQDDTALLSAVKEEHHLIYNKYFKDELEVNHELPIITHAFRRMDQWRVFLLLTPWMLARVFIPDTAPDLEIPAEWRADARRSADYRVIGPTFDLNLLTGKQKAHLNYSDNIGHYLLHPLILSMSSFQTPNDVFEAWNKVIVARNENLEKMQKKNLHHAEISRREFFSGTRRK